MKKLIRSVIMTAVVWAPLCDANAAVLTNFALGLSPFYPTSASTEIEYSIKKFILDAPKGSRIRIDDALNLKIVAAFSVPNLQYDSAANRARLLAPVLAKVTQWFAAARTSGGSPLLINSSVLSVPEYLDFIAGNGSEGPRAILLVGSPFAQYPTEPSFSMTGPDEDPRVPSDGHLAVSLQQSPYGTAERKGKLLGSQVSWCYGNENVWRNGLAKTLTMRFWVLFTKLQNASMVAFTPDLATAFDGLPKAGLPPIGSFDLNPEDTKLEMRVARPRQVPTWLSQTPLENRPSTPVAPGTDIRPTTPPRLTPAKTRLPRDLSQPIASPVEIGIVWESSDPALDLDIYVCPRPGAEELSFGKARTREGAYVRDWRQPNITTDLEWVILKPGVRLSEVSAWVNLFSGGGPITATVVVRFENTSYGGQFEVKATQGNRAVDSARRDQSPSWTRIDLSEIVQHGDVIP